MGPPGSQNPEGYDAVADSQRGRDAAASLNAALYGKPVEMPHLAHLSAEEKERMDKAADYTDEWFHVAGPRGPVALRVFYVCARKVGATETCSTLTTSSAWQRKHEDPLQSQQRWYCPICGATYKTRSGTMVQMVLNGESMFVRAEIPTEAFKQVKAASVQRTHAHATTPEELLRAIPEAAVRATEWLQPVTGMRGVYTYTEEVFKDIPLLQWDQLLAECLTERRLDQGAPPPPPPPPLEPAMGRGRGIQPEQMVDARDL